MNLIEKLIRIDKETLLGSCKTGRGIYSVYF